MVAWGGWDLAKLLQQSSLGKAPIPCCLLTSVGQGFEVLGVLLSVLIPMKKNKKIKQDGKNIRTRGHRDRTKIREKPWSLNHDTFHINNTTGRNQWTSMNFFQLNGIKSQPFYFLEGRQKFSLLFKYFCSYNLFSACVSFPLLPMRSLIIVFETY